MPTGGLDRALQKSWPSEQGGLADRRRTNELNPRCFEDGFDFEQR